MENNVKTHELTDNQRKLIEDNLKEIQKILSFVLFKKPQCRRNIKQLVLEALSHLPSVAKEYCPIMAKGKSFAKYATQRCLLRSIDEYRTLNRHSRRIDGSEPGKDKATHERIIKVDPKLKNLEWEDFRDGLLKKADKFFEEHNNCHIHKILITDYLLPKCEGRKYKTLREVANQVGVGEPRLSQIVRGDLMKKFIEYIYE